MKIYIANDPGKTNITYINKYPRIIEAPCETYPPPPRPDTMMITPYTAILHPSPLIPLGLYKNPRNKKYCY